MEAIQAELINLAILVITALVGYLTKEAGSYFHKSGMSKQVENNKMLVNIVVTAVEQMYHELEGPEKLHLAKLELVAMMQKKKIKVTEKEVDLLIESAVKEMKLHAKPKETTVTVDTVNIPLDGSK